MEEEYVDIGKIDIEILKQFCDIKTDRLIITKERIEHINKRHKNDYNLYGNYMSLILEEPDFILEDIENKETILYLKTIEGLNLQMVVRLQIENSKEKSNTVITFWHMRERSYKQIIKKNNIIYKKLDKNA